MSKGIKFKYCKYCKYRKYCKKYIGDCRTMASFHLNHPRCLFFCEDPEVECFQKICILILLNLPIFLVVMIDLVINWKL